MIDRWSNEKGECVIDEKTETDERRVDLRM